MRAGARSRSGERGIALLLVIWGLALLSAVAVAVGADGRGARRLARNAELAAKSQAVAEGGIWWGVAQLLERRGTPIDGTIQKIRIGDTVLAISIESETGKVDLNTTSSAVLEILLQRHGAEAAEAHRIAATLDAYRKTPRTEPGRPLRLAFLETLDLRRVTAIDDGLYRAILPSITVYSGRPRLDWTTAPSTVLLSVPGASAGRVEAILRQRATAQVGDATVALAGAGEMENYLGRAPGRIFTIRSTVAVEMGSEITRSAVVELTGRPQAPIHIHDWAPETR